jgi:hypothetical protein
MPNKADPKKPATFEAGFARRVITPPVGTSLAGFFHDRVSKQVRDDLLCRAIILRDGDCRIALVALDLICVDSDFVDKAKALITAETGIPPERVTISASHTHTGPEVRLVGNKVPRNEPWLAGLPRLIAAAVAEANSRLIRVTLRTGRMETEGYAFNRLYRLNDGTEQMGQQSNREKILGPAGPVDKALQTLSFMDAQGQLRGMIVNFGMHPVTVAGENADFLSADWPGEMTKHLSQMYGNDMLAMFLQGSCGDINHMPYEASLLPQWGPAKTVQLGRGLAGAAAYAAERAEPETTQRLAAFVREINVPYYTRTPEIFAEAASLKERSDLDAAQQYFVKAVAEWPFDGKICKAPLQVIRIGDLAIVAIPAQIFTRIGLEMKAWSPAKHTMLVELANARVASYVPTADQVERGAYGSRPIVSRWLIADTGRRMIDGILVMLQELWREPANR